MKYLMRYISSVTLFKKSYILIGEICLFMTKKTNSPVLFNTEEIYKIFFCDGECVVDLDFPMVLLYFLDSMARDDDKIILINVNQENNLFDEEFVLNGTNKICLDNLNHVYVQKYVKEVESYDVTSTTDLDSFVDENCKFSNFLADLIVKLLSIEQISYQKVGEILELFLGVKIPRQRVYDLFNKEIDGYLCMSIQELQEKIIDGEIEFSGLVHYDEEFIWIKHQPYVRLTLLDAENKLIIEDTVVSRELFTKDYIKTFLETSLENLEVKTIITDGYKAYASIIDDLGFNHQRCTFHAMKNLMDKLIKKHNGLNRGIKKLNTKIKELEKEIKEISKKYKGQKGRTRKDDKERQEDNEKKKKLNKELSEKKAERKKCTNKLKRDDQLVKKISLIFKSKTEKTARKRFQTLYDNLDDLPKEIKAFIKNLSKYIDKAIQHTINREIPSTNNLIEGFYKTTLPGKLKKIFKTYRGLLIRITLNNIRWINRCVIINKN